MPTHMAVAAQPGVTRHLRPAATSLATLPSAFMVPSHWWPLLIFGGMRVSVLGTPPLTMKLVPLHRTINIPQRCETSLTLFLISSNVNLDSKIFFFFFCWRGIGRGCPYDCNTSTQITSQVAKPHQKCTSIWTPHQSSPIVNTTPLKHMRHRLIVLLSKAHAYIYGFHQPTSHPFSGKNSKSIHHHGTCVVSPPFSNIILYAYLPRTVNTIF